MADEEVRSEHDDFIRTMLDKAAKKEKIEPQSRTGNVKEEDVEQKTKDIMEKLQKE